LCGLDVLARAAAVLTSRCCLCCGGKIGFSSNKHNTGMTEWML
jgi:hypothetical protein